MNEFDRLKVFMKSIIDGDTPQKANIQGFSILVTYLVKNVSDSLLTCAANRSGCRAEDRTVD
jgi:hypothetical protein